MAVLASARLLAVAVVLEFAGVGTGSTHERISPYTAPDVVQQAGRTLLTFASSACQRELPSPF
jgi:hypothetical protein